MSTIELSKINRGSIDEDDGSEESGFSNDDGAPNPNSYDDDEKDIDEYGTVTLQTINMDAEYVLKLRRRRTYAIVAMVVLCSATALLVFLKLYHGGEVSSTPSAGGVSSAEESDMSVHGRSMKFYVDQLDGNEGETGEFTVQLRPSWAPAGARRFEVRFVVNSSIRVCKPPQLISLIIHYNMPPSSHIQELTEAKFWVGCRIFRVLPGFVSQVCLFEMSSLGCLVQYDPPFAFAAYIYIFHLQPKTNCCSPLPLCFIISVGN